jgi:hypothetical protein
MFELQLTPEEKETLVNILNDFVSNLRVEIVDTDSPQHKDQLRNERDTVNNLLNKLNQAKAN